LPSAECFDVTGSEAAGKTGLPAWQRVSTATGRAVLYDLLNTGDGVI